MADIDLTGRVPQTERAPHIWGPAPPGTGSKHERVCRKCGQRRSIVGEDSHCKSQPAQAVVATQHSYDPFNDPGIDLDAQRRARNKAARKDQKKASEKGKPARSEFDLTKGRMPR